MWHSLAEESADYPKFNTDVLCWVLREPSDSYPFDGTVLVGRYCGDGRWSFAETSGETVTHWMPLPHAPKE